MLFTAEVRWFLDGAASDALRDHFEGPALSLGMPHSAELVSAEGARVDTYLLLPGSEVVGVKFRQGMFEIKAARAPSRTRQLTESCAGALDTWCKMSIASSAFEIGSVWPEDLGYVRHVLKRRILRGYVVGAEVTSRRLDRPEEEGCNVELTEVRLVDGPDPDSAGPAGATFHTIGFEGYGAPGEVERLRDSAIDALIDTLAGSAAGLTLRAENSLSYPAWLARQG